MPTKTFKALASNYCNEVNQQYSYSHGEDDLVPPATQWSILKCQE
jgi:hypothetical protein